MKITIVKTVYTKESRFKYYDKLDELFAILALSRKVVTSMQNLTTTVI